MNTRNKIEIKARHLWGEDLHKNYSAPAHCFQLESIFKTKWKESHMEVYSLFSIWWDKEWSHWAKVPEYCNI